MMHPHDRTRRVKKLTVRSVDTVIQEMRAFKVTEVADAGYGRGHTCAKGYAVTTGLRLNISFSTSTTIKNANSAAP